MSEDFVNYDLAMAITRIEKARDVEFPLGGLFRAHTKAYSQFEEICDFDDYISPEDPSFPMLEAEYAQRNEAEKASMTAVCAYEARNLAEHATKALFFLKYMDGGGELEANQLRVLWSSVLGEKLAREALEAGK